METQEAYIHIGLLHSNTIEEMTGERGKMRRGRWGRRNRKKGKGGEGRRCGGGPQAGLLLKWHPIPYIVIIAIWVLVKSNALNRE